MSQPICHTRSPVFISLPLLRILLSSLFHVLWENVDQLFPLSFFLHPYPFILLRFYLLNVLCPIQFIVSIISSIVLHSLTSISCIVFIPFLNHYVMFPLHNPFTHFLAPSLCPMYKLLCETHHLGSHLLAAVFPFTHSLVFYFLTLRCSHLFTVSRSHLPRGGVSLSASPAAPPCHCLPMIAFNQQFI